jgi:capsular polysaccharide biosynthesis protein
MSSLQKSIIAVVFITILSVFLGYLLLSTPSYQVRATILIQRNEFGVPQIDEFLVFNNAEVSNVIQKLKSVYLLEKTLQKLNYNLSTTSEEFLRIKKNLSVRQIPGSNAIEISLRHPVLKEATQIVNTLVETLRQDDMMEHRSKIQQALISVQTALALVQNENPAAQVLQPNIKRSAIDTYLKEINDDLYKTEQRLIVLQSDLSQNQMDIINETFTPRSLERFKPGITIAEKKLAGYLLAGSWNSQNVQNQLKKIWKEKTKITATLKEQLDMRLDIPIRIIDDICAYQIRRFDLQIRKQEFIQLKRTYTSSEAKPSSAELNKPYESLRKIETDLIEKQTILQSLNDITLTKINWLDKALPVKPALRSNILLTFGFSFGLALFAAFITGLFFVEYNSYQRRLRGNSYHDSSN